MLGVQTALQGTGFYRNGRLMLNFRRCSREVAEYHSYFSSHVYHVGWQSEAKSESTPRWRRIARPWKDRGHRELCGQMTGSRPPELRTRPASVETL